MSRPILCFSQLNGRFMLVARGFCAGSIITYSGIGGQWSGTALSLSTGGDQVLVFQGSQSAPEFVFAVDFNGKAAQVRCRETDGVSPTCTCALAVTRWMGGSGQHSKHQQFPAAAWPGCWLVTVACQGQECGLQVRTRWTATAVLRRACGITDDCIAACVYRGILSGTRAELLSAITDAANWFTSSSRLTYSDELEIVPDDDDGAAALVSPTHSMLLFAIVAAAATCFAARV